MVEWAAMISFIANKLSSISTMLRKRRGPFPVRVRPLTNFATGMTYQYSFAQNVEVRMTRLTLTSHDLGEAGLVLEVPGTVGAGAVTDDVRCAHSSV
jgi:hypothetical protein